LVVPDAAAQFVKLQWGRRVDGLGLLL
jgi:hypothetical protein